MSKAMNWLSAIIDRLCVVAGALIFSQAPQFFSQYTQRLAGHAEEIKIHTAAIRYAAQKSGKELMEYVQKLSSHPDLDVSLQGEMMQNMMIRQVELSKSFLAMQDATPFTRPFLFLKYFNPDITKATLMQFQPGLVFSMEAMVYAVVGMGIGFSLFHFFAFLCRKCLPKKHLIR